MKACPNKSSKVYKQIDSRFPEHTAEIWLKLDDEKFRNWYGSDSLPLLTVRNTIRNTRGQEYSIFKAFKFTSKEEVKKFLSSSETIGVNAYKGEYWATQDSHKRSIFYENLRAINEANPGLLEKENLGPSKGATHVDQWDSTGMNIIRIRINENALASNKPVLTEYLPATSTQTAEAQADIAPDIQKVINNLKFRISNYKSQLSDKISVERRVELKERVEKLERNIEQLLDQRSLSAISEIANSQLSWTEHLLSQPTISDSDITHITKTLAIWKDIDNQMITDGELGPETVKILGEIVGKARALENKALAAARRNVLAQADSIFTEEATEDSLFSAQADTSATSAYTRDLSQVKHKLAQFISLKLKNAATFTNSEFQEAHNQIKEATDDLAKSPIFKQYGFNIFKQLDENGKETGNIVTRPAQKWYSLLKKSSETRKAAIKNADGDPKKVSQAWKKYIDFIKTNTFTVDSRILFQKDEEGGFKYSEKDRTEHVDALRKQFGETRVKDIIEQARKQIDKYEKEKEVIQDQISVREALPESDPQHLDGASAARELDGWTIRNSPYTYLDSVIGNVKHISSSLSRYEGHRYTISKPLSSINGKDTGYYDKNYEKIESDPHLKKYYDFYRATYKEMLGHVPYQSHLQANYIPDVAKSLIEEMYETGKAGVFKHLRKDVLSMITESVGSAISYQERNPITDRLEKGIPVHHLNDTLDPSSKSYDLSAVLLRFSYTALNYKHKSKVEDVVLLSQRILNELKEAEVEGGIQKIDRFGSPITYKNGLANLKAQVNYTIDSLLYENNKKKEGITNKRIEGVHINSKQAVAIKEELNELDSKLANNEISQEEYDEQYKPLEEKYKTITGANVSYSKIGDSLIGYTRLKGLGWNIYSGFANLTFGLISNVVHANGRTDFSNRDIVKATGIMLHATRNGLGNSNPTAKKIEHLADLFDLLGEIGDKINGNAINQSKVKSAISKLSPMNINKSTEYFVQGQTMVSMLLAYKIKDNVGIEHSLWDAYDEHGHLKDSFSNNEGFSKNGELDETSDFIKFKNRLTEVKKTIHGNFDPNSPILIKDTILGRMFTVFRTWIPEGVYSRFQDEHFNETIGRTVKGRYRTYGTLKFWGSIKTLSKQAIWMKPDKTFVYSDGSPMSSVDIENMRKNLSEIAFGLAITGLLMALKAGLKDDDDEDASRMRIVINTLMRTEADIYFFVNPFAADQVIQNAVPLAKTLEDAGKAVKSGAILIYDDFDPELDESDIERHENHVLNSLPAANMISKTRSLGKRLMN